MLATRAPESAAVPTIASPGRRANARTCSGAEAKRAYRRRCELRWTLTAALESKTERLERVLGQLDVEPDGSAHHSCRHPRPRQSLRPRPAQIVLSEHALPRIAEERVARCEPCRLLSAQRNRLDHQPV